MSGVPLTSSAQTFFAPSAPEEVRKLISEEEIRRVKEALVSDHEEKTVCRWCLQRFDPSKQAPRSIAERGYLRTHLKMSDNGRELVCCDECWSSAIGSRIWTHGQVIPCADPNEVTNPLLRQSLTT